MSPQEVILSIDSNIFIGAAYDFHGIDFSALARYCEEGFIKLVISSVVKREVEKHITDDVSEICKKINANIANRCLSAWRKCTESDTIQSAFNPLSIVSVIQGQFEEFIHKTKCEFISTESVVIEDILSDHFSLQPPFEKAKPCEFKDAIIVHSLRAYQAKCCKPLYIISNDNGFLTSFQGYQQFVTFNSISSLLDHINQEFKADEYIRIKEFLKNTDLSEQIQQGIREILDNTSFSLDFDSDFPCDDLEVLRISTCKYKVDTINDITDGVAEVAMVTECRIIIEYDFFDEMNSIYDEVEHEYEYAHFADVLEEHIIQFSFCISLTTKEVITIKKIFVENTPFELSLDEFTLVSRKRLDNNPFDIEEFNEWVSNSKCKNCGCEITQQNDGGNGYCYRCCVE